MRNESVKLNDQVVAHVTRRTLKRYLLSQGWRVETTWSNHRSLDIEASRCDVTLDHTGGRFGKCRCCQFLRFGTWRNTPENG